MKQNTETISESIFTHFPSRNIKKNQLSTLQIVFLSFYKKTICPKVLTRLKDQLLSGIVTLGIGTVFLVSVYLFFIQLAEHGWQ